MANDEHPEWFNTPVLKYLAMKKEFLNTFTKCEWGAFGTKQQVIAVASLLDYLDRTRNLSDQFPQIKEEIILENKKMFIQRIINIPDKLYEELLLAVVEGAQEEYQYIWQQPSSATLDKIQKFLIRQKEGCLALYQCKMWSEDDLNDFAQAKPPDEAVREDGRKAVNKSKADLRKLRNDIYWRIRRRRKVKKDVRKYHTMTEDFIDRFKSDLTVDEAAIMRNKVKILRSSARASKPKAIIRRQFRRTTDIKMEAYIEKDRLGMDEQSCDTEGVQSSRIDVDPRNISVQDLSVPVPCAEHEVSDSRAAARYQDLQVLTDQVVLLLPDVPHEPGNDTGVVDVSGEEIDEQIRTRLTKLQFFSKTWAQNSSTLSSSLNPAAIEEISEDGIEDSKSSPEHEMIPVESTKQDRQNFNNWYYDQVDKTPDYYVRNEHFAESDFKYPSCLKSSTVLPNKVSTEDCLDMTNTSQYQGRIMIVTNSQTRAVQNLNLTPTMTQPLKILLLF